RPPPGGPLSISTPGPRLFSSRQLSALLLSKTCGGRLSFLTRHFSVTRHLSTPTTSSSMFTDSFIHCTTTTLRYGSHWRTRHSKPRLVCGLMPEKHTWLARNTCITANATTLVP